MKQLFTLLLVLFISEVNSQTLYPIGSPPGAHYNSPSGSINEVECVIKDNLNNLFVAGSFSVAGAVTASNVAMWNGTSWSAIGGGTNGRVHEIFFFQGNLIAGGQFNNAGGTSVNNIASWNGTSWQAMGSGFNAAVYALGVFNGTLIAGGAFTSSGATPVNKIAQWNGTAWVGFPIASPFSSGLVHDVLQFNNELYIGGESLPGGNQMWKWNGTAFVNAGSNTVNQSGYKLIVHNNELYTTGDQNGLNPYTPSKLVAGTWTPMVATGFAAGIYGMHSYNGQIYVGTNDNAVPCLWRHNGTSWVNVAGGVSTGQYLNSHVWDFETLNGDLYFGGRFQNIGGATLANNVGRFNSPAAPTASFTPPPNACAGACFTFSDQSVNTPTSWVWSFPGSATPSSNIQNPTNICYSVTGTYSVTLTANSIYGSGVLSQTFIVNAIPGAGGSVSGNTLFCRNTVQTYSVPAITGATSYTWSLPGGWTGGSNTNTISVTTNSTSGSVSVTGGNACGSSTTAPLSATINPSPIITPSTNIALLCTGSSATLTVSGGTSYTWNPGGVGASIVVSPTLNTTYTVTGINLAGCQNTAAILQSVDPCTGIFSQVRSQDITLYPNPTNGMIELSGIEENIVLKIFNAQGKLVCDKILTIHETQLNITELNNGIYFIKLNNLKTNFSLKVIKE